jgi:hypothetical protein
MKKDSRTREEKLDDLAADAGATDAERANAAEKAEAIRQKHGKGTVGGEAWRADVELGRELLKSLDQHQWDLGKLAANVPKKYGEANFEQFAKAIGIKFKTLKNYRGTWNAWFGGETARSRADSEMTVSYSTACALNAHPDRWDLIKKRPDITEEEAREIVKESIRNRQAKSPTSKKRTVSSRDNASEEFTDLVARLLQKISKQKPSRYSKTGFSAEDLNKLADFFKKLAKLKADAASSAKAA